MDPPSPAERRGRRVRRRSGCSPPSLGGGFCGLSETTTHSTPAPSEDRGWMLAPRSAVAWELVGLEEECSFLSAFIKSHKVFTILKQT